MHDALCATCYMLCNLRNVCISMVMGTFFNVLCVTCCALRVVHCEECVYFLGFAHILLCAISCVLCVTCCAYREMCVCVCPWCCLACVDMCDMLCAVCCVSRIVRNVCISFV